MYLQLSDQSPRRWRHHTASELPGSWWNRKRRSRSFLQETGLRSPPFLSRLPLLCPLFLQPYHEWRGQLLGVSSHTFDPNWSWARVCNPLGQRPRFLLNGVAMMCLPSAASEGPSAWLSVSALIKQRNISSSHFCGSRLLTLSYYCLFDTNGHVKPQTLLENMYLVGVRIFEDLGLPILFSMKKNWERDRGSCITLLGAKSEQSFIDFFFSTSDLTVFCKSHATLNTGRLAHFVRCEGNSLRRQTSVKDEILISCVLEGRFWRCDLGFTMTCE